MIEAREITDGLVLRLDPDELEAAGGRRTDTDSVRVEGPHFFLCIASNEQSGNWVPLFSSAGPQRTLVANGDKAGPAAWRESTTFIHRKQVWHAPHSAVVDAAIAGGDLSQPGLRNTFTEAGVDAAYEVVFPDSATGRTA